MANQEQLIFGAIVVGVALIYLNSGKDLSAAALAAGPDDDTPSDAAIRAKALEDIEGRLVVNERQQGEWTVRCKAELDTLREANRGEGAPGTEGLVVSGYQILNGLSTEAKTILARLVIIVRDHDQHVRPSEAWTMNIEKTEFRRQQADLAEFMRGWATDLEMRKEDGHKARSIHLSKVVAQQQVNNTRTLNVLNHNNTFIDQSDRSSNPTVNLTRSQTLSVTMDVDSSESPMPPGPRTLPRDRGKPEPSLPDENDPVPDGFVTPRADNRDVITDGAAAEGANRGTNPPPPRRYRGPPMTDTTGVEVRSALRKRYLKEKAEGQLAKRPFATTWEEWLAAQQGGAGGGSVASARATDEEDARRAKEELDAKQRGRVAPKRKPEEGAPATAFNQSNRNRPTRSRSRSPSPVYAHENPAKKAKRLRDRGLEGYQEVGAAGGLGVVSRFPRIDPTGQSSGVFPVTGTVPGGWPDQRPGTSTGPRKPTVERPNVPVGATADAKRSGAKRAKVGPRGDPTPFVQRDPPKAVDKAPPMAKPGVGDGSSDKRPRTKISDEMTKIEAVSEKTKRVIEVMDAKLAQDANHPVKGGVGFKPWEDHGRAKILELAWHEVIRMSNIDDKTTVLVKRIFAGRDPSRGKGKSGEPVGTGEFSREYEQWNARLIERKKQFTAFWRKYVGDGKLFDARGASRKGPGAKTRQAWGNKWASQFTPENGFYFNKQYGLGTLEFGRKKKK